jgi:hypothetical protein
MSLEAAKKALSPPLTPDGIRLAERELWEEVRSNPKRAGNCFLLASATGQIVALVAGNPITPDDLSAIGEVVAHILKGIHLEATKAPADEHIAVNNEIVLHLQELKARLANSPITVRGSPGANKKSARSRS